MSSVTTDMIQSYVTVANNMLARHGAAFRLKFNRAYDYYRIEYVKPDGIEIVKDPVTTGSKADVYRWLNGFIDGMSYKDIK